LTISSFGDANYIRAICTEEIKRLPTGTQLVSTGVPSLLGLWAFGHFFVRLFYLPPPSAHHTNSHPAGFVRRVQGTSNGNGWDHVYDLSYFFGFFVSGTIHAALHTIAPAKKQTGSSLFEMELHRTRRADGGRPPGYVESTTSHDEENVVVGKEKDVSV